MSDKIKFNINDYKKEVEENNKKCIATKLNTDRMTDAQKEEYIKNLNGLYEFSKLEKPKNIVFVTSPILLAFASGAARYYWNEVIHKTDNATCYATRNATYDATRNATYDATRSATDNATDSATRSGTSNATYDATRSATASATYDATRSATASATYNATNSATDNATNSATRSATNSATDNATRSATRSATNSATYNATRNATYNATRSATASATDNATRSATDNAINDLSEICEGVIVPENYTQEIFQFFNDNGINFDMDKLIDYIKGFSSVYQGGNNWADWDYYLNFYREIGKPIPNYDYTGFDYWFKLNTAGTRVLDKDFAMISEKPTVIKMKGDLAHNLNGAAIEYMDGVKFYMAYGSLIPSWIVTTPIKDITKDMILNEKNADYRRYLIERIGIEKYIDILGGANVIDMYESKVGGKYELLEIEIDNEKCKYLKMQNRSEFVWHIEGVENSVNSCKQALMFRNRMRVFKEPKFMS